MNWVIFTSFFVVSFSGALQRLSLLLLLGKKIISYTMQERENIKKYMLSLWSFFSSFNFTLSCVTYSRKCMGVFNLRNLILGFVGFICFQTESSIFGHYKVVVKNNMVPLCFTVTTADTFAYCYKTDENNEWETS